MAVAKPGAKAGDVPAQPNADTGEAPKKKPRGPRKDYGYKRGAKITISAEADGKKYKGKRGEYWERLKAADGKTVEEFFQACPKGDPPRGWLRFFVTDGAASLSGGEDPVEKEAA